MYEVFWKATGSYETTCKTLAAAKKAARETGANAVKVMKDGLVIKTYIWSMWTKSWKQF